MKSYRSFAWPKMLGALTFLLAFCFSSLWASENGVEYDRMKAQFLIKKGLKEQNRGDMESAIVSFEEAFEVNPGDASPLLLKAQVYCHFRLFVRAEDSLAAISLKILDSQQKIIFHTITAQIEMAKDNLESAAVSFADILKLDSRHTAAVARLAMINECFGNLKRVNNLLADIEDISIADFQDTSIFFLLRLLHGDFLQAFHLAGEISSRLDQVEFQSGRNPSLFSLWKNPTILFISNLYFSFGGVFGCFYLLVLLILVTIFAIQFTPETSLKIDLFFIGLAFIHCFGFFEFGIPAVRIALLKGSFNHLSPIWIIPRLLCGMHLITLALFFIFPVFRILPARIRPHRFELYSIWFFCFWFMLFVLIFQSQMSFSKQIPYLLSSLAIAVVSSLFMPMGRFLVFLLGQKIGLGGYVTAPGDILESSKSFTDGKILEAKAQTHLERGEFDQVLSISRKVFSSFPNTSFPGLWVSKAKAEIETEDFFAAEKTINSFLELFPNLPQNDFGQLIFAFLKSLKGDHAGALKVIHSYTEERAKAFSSEQLSWSLYILARCNKHFGHNVQAHIEFSKALPLALVPITKARILCDLTEMDILMNRLEWAQKWQIEGKTVKKGGAKAASFLKIIDSMILSGNNSMDESLKKAEEACDLCKLNSTAWAWRGQVLCKTGRHSEAEALLQKMTHGTEDAEKLMQVITKKS